MYEIKYTDLFNMFLKLYDLDIIKNDKESYDKEVVKYEVYFTKIIGNKDFYILKDKKLNAKEQGHHGIIVGYLDSIVCDLPMLLSDICDKFIEMNTR